MKKKGLPVVYMHPKEKPVAWVGMFMLLKGSSRPKLAHAYVDAWSSAKSGKWLEDNYGYGHANVKARPSSSDLLRALKLDEPAGRHAPRTRTSTATYPAGRSTRRSGRRSRPPDGVVQRRAPTSRRPALLGLPLALAPSRSFFLAPIGIVAAYSVDVLALVPGTARLHVPGVARLFPQLDLPELFWKSVEMSLIVSAIIVVLAYPLAYYLALSGTKRKYVLLLLLIAPFLTSYLLRVLAWKVILGDQGVHQHVPVLDGAPVARRTRLAAPLQPVRGHARARVHLAALRRAADLRLAREPRPAPARSGERPRREPLAGLPASDAPAVGARASSPRSSSSSSRRSASS